MPQLSPASGVMVYILLIILLMYSISMQSYMAHSLQYKEKMGVNQTKMMMTLS
uniref:ATP synthase F0 subunit 8 n=1 Tax=Orcula dolium TaxID=1331962 RepID=A0A1W5ICD4_9EUPU|nr:ATP synthase F0 subunit 8 [Orcula dolium]AIR76276.1 ATP synthase F0 subunit 8 [Orcula dolium]